jgi:beta-lactamase regulating signal transducer with metallopeptidase domain
MDAARLASSVVSSLIEASIAGGLAVVLAWIICTHGRLRPRWQAIVWWAVSLKLLMVLAGVPSIPVPVLPAAHTPVGAVTTRSTADVTPAPALTAAATAARIPPRASTSAVTTTQAVSGLVIATRVLAGVWLLGVAIALVGLCLSDRRLRRLKRRASSADEATVDIVEQVAARAGVRRVPPTVVSEDIRAPQTIGALRPVILLPARARDRWSDDELRMALSHELAHVRRRDLLWGWVPVVAESLFFFHPLARLAAREYLVAREAACDAEAIDTAQAAPDDYARLLIRLGIERSGGALAAGGASGSRSVLTRRLEMLVPAPRNLSRPGRVALAVLAALALLPLQLTARQTEAPRAVTAAPAAPLQAARPVAPGAPGEPAVPVTAAPAAPTRPARPVARAAQQTPAPAQTEPSSPVPSPAPRSVERAQPNEAALRKEIEAARPEAEDAAREIRALERALREERARASRTDAEATALLFQERVRGLEAKARQLEALRASPQVTGASSDERMRLLREQLQLLAVQQNNLLNEQQALAQQQQALADAQRRVAEQLARVREALDRAR